MNRTRPRSSPQPSTQPPSRSSAEFSAIALLVCLAWAVLAWLSAAPAGWCCAPSPLWHKVASVILATSLAIHLFLSVNFQPPD
ncbi:MAG: hypothetical protein ACK4WH_12280 [Phycisphaerales bacterium]